MGTRLRGSDSRRIFGPFRRCLHGAPLYYATLRPAEYERLLRANGFTTLDHQAEDPERGNHTVWIAVRQLLA